MLMRIMYMVLLLPVFIFSQNNEINLRIETNKPGCTIYLNGVEVAKGSYFAYLTPGKYNLKIIEDIYKWNGETIVDSLIVDSVKVLSKKYEFPERVYLSTTPEDVYVKSEDKLLGNTPLFLPIKTEKIFLYKPNYSDKEIDLLHNKKEYNVNLEYNGTPPGISFRKTPWFKVLVGAALVLGGTAAYYKIEADKNYEMYLETNDITYLDNTDNYDTYSGLAFGALQVNFAFILYFLLSD